MKAKTFLLGVFIGGAAAGIATLLSAPQSGKETRKALYENKNVALLHLKDLKNSLLDLKETVLVASKESKVTIGTFISDAKIAVDSWKRETEQSQLEIKSEIIEIEKAISELEKGLTKVN